MLIATTKELVPIDHSTNAMDPGVLVHPCLLHDVSDASHIPDPTNLVMETGPAGLLHPTNLGLLQPYVLTVEAVLSSAAAASNAVLICRACSTYMIHICGSHTGGDQRNFRESPTPSSTGSYQAWRAC